MRKKSRDTRPIYVLKREWGFIFRSIKRRGTVQKRIDTRARSYQYAQVLELMQQNEQKNSFLWLYEIRAPVHNRPFMNAPVQ